MSKSKKFGLISLFFVAIGCGGPYGLPELEVEETTRFEKDDTVGLQIRLSEGKSFQEIAKKMPLVSGGWELFAESDTHWYANLHYSSHNTDPKDLYFVSGLYRVKKIEGLTFEKRPVVLLKRTATDSSEYEIVAYGDPKKEGNVGRMFYEKKEFAFQGTGKTVTTFGPVFDGETEKTAKVIRVDRIPGNKAMPTMHTFFEDQETGTLIHIEFRYPLPKKLLDDDSTEFELTYRPGRGLSNEEMVSFKKAD